MLATFEASEERFQVWVTNPQAMWDLRQLQRGESTANVPNGRVLRGPGLAGHNSPYSWHLDPEDTSMADFTIEVCDAEPSYVEENVDEFVDNVGRATAPKTPGWWGSRTTPAGRYAPRSRGDAAPCSLPRRGVRSGASPARRGGRPRTSNLPKRSSARLCPASRIKTLRRFGRKTA